MQCPVDTKADDFETKAIVEAKSPIRCLKFTATSTIKHQFYLTHTHTNIQSFLLKESVTTLRNISIWPFWHD